MEIWGALMQRHPLFRGSGNKSYLRAGGSAFFSKNLMGSSPRASITTCTSAPGSVLNVCEFTFVTSIFTLASGNKSVGHFKWAETSNPLTLYSRKLQFQNRFSHWLKDINWKFYEALGLLLSLPHRKVSFDKTWADFLKLQSYKDHPNYQC